MLGRIQAALSQRDFFTPGIFFFECPSTACEDNCGQNHQSPHPGGVPEAEVIGDNPPKKGSEGDAGVKGGDVDGRCDILRLGSVTLG